MKEKLKQHLNEVFRGAPHTAKNEALYEELLANLYDRYDERIAAGDGEEEACRRVIADLGDIRPLIEQAPQNGETTVGVTFEEAPIAPDEGEKLYRYKWRRGLGTAGAVALFILSVVPCLFADWAAALLFAFVAAGVVLIIMIHRGEKMYDRSARAYDADLCRKQDTLATGLTAAGVALCILSVIPASLLDNAAGAALLFAAVALGVFGIVLGAHIRPADERAGTPAVGSAGTGAAGEAAPAPRKRHPVLVAVLCGVAALIVVGTTLGIVAWRTDTHIWFEKREARRYTETGGGTVNDAVTALDIDWRAGSVNVEPYDGDTVTFSETRGGEAVSDPDDAMRWYFADGTLHVRFEKWRWFHFERGDVAGKQLTVYLPRDMADGLTEIDVDNVSAAVTVREVKVSRVIRIDTVSGAVTLTDVQTDRLGVDTVSGDVNAEGLTCRQLNVDAVSARITASGAIKETDVDTVSGALTLTPGAEAQRIDCDSVSGNITVILPADVGVTVDMESVSGRIDSTVALTSSGGRHTSGDGAVSIDVDTVSGNLILRTAA